MAWSNPFYRDDNPLGRALNIVCCLMLAAMGCMVSCYMDARKEDAKEAFNKQDYFLIAVYENEPTSQKALVNAYKNKLESKPVSVYTDKDGDLEMFKTASDEYAGDLPRPMYIQKMNGSFYPIYAVFKGPDALNKFRMWAKDHNYAGWYFEPQCHILNDTYLTKEVELKKTAADGSISRPSTLSFTAYFNSRKGRLYLWDGFRIYDYSGGMSGMTRDPASHRKFTSWLVKLGV